MALVPELRKEELEATKLHVCVTGASGYVAGHIVRRLLAAGHTVRATVRDPSNTRSVSHLKSLPGAAERLLLYQADLLQEGAFDRALVGCSVLLHTASPYAVDVKPGQARAVIETAVQGTENVLRSADRTPGLRRVVLTASIASIFSDPHERGFGHEFTEEDWNLTATSSHLPYFHSKTEAERRAWHMAAAAGGRWDLVTIHPPAIWGPPLGNRADGESVSQVVDLLSGRLWPWAPPLGTGVVDVRDVALAHCLAAVLPDASGRYIVCAGCKPLLSHAARLLRRRFPAQRVPPLTKPPRGALLAFGPLLGLPRDVTRAMYGKVPIISAARAAKELGLQEYISIDQTIVEMAEQVLARGMVPAWVVPNVAVLALYVYLPLMALALLLGLGLRAWLAA